MLVKEELLRPSTTDALSTVVHLGAAQDLWSTSAWAMCTEMAERTEMAEQPKNKPHKHTHTHTHTHTMAD